MTTWKRNHLAHRVALPPSMARTDCRTALRCVTDGQKNIEGVEFSAIYRALTTLSVALSCVFSVSLLRFVCLGGRRAFIIRESAGGRHGNQRAFSTGY
jgi:hypothetical protein